MQPSRRKGGAILETYQELDESQDVLVDIPGQHADDLAQSLDREPPYEISREDVWMIMRGIKSTLSKEGLAEDYRDSLEQLRSGYERISSPEHQEEIAQWFVPSSTPEGGAPEEIRAQWIGVPLPVRKSNVVNTDLVGDYVIGANVLNPTDVKVNEPEAMVTVYAIDAFKALRLASRDDAAEWWETWFEHRHPMLGTRLMFRTSEGQIYANDEIEENFAGSSSFDSIVN